MINKSKKDFILQYLKDKKHTLTVCKTILTQISVDLKKSRHEAAFDLSLQLKENSMKISEIDKCLEAQKDWKNQLNAVELRELLVMEDSCRQLSQDNLGLINSSSCDITEQMKETEKELRLFSSNRNRFTGLSGEESARILDIKS